MAPTQPDYSGLQAVHEYNAPEVVPETMLRGPLERRSSMGSPEVYKEQDEKHSNIYSDSNTNGSQIAESHAETSPEYLEAHGQPTGQESRKRDRICGLRKRAFIILASVLLLVIIIAAVVGGVVGSLTHKHRSTSSQTSSSSSNNLPAIKTIKDSGITLMVPAGSTGESGIYTYYQAENGTILERWFGNGTLNNSTLSNIVGTGAKQGSPLAATSWTNSDSTYRQLFFLDNDGSVMTTNTTGDQAWSQPYNILTNDTAHPDTKALAVCSATNQANQGLNGIRVYYGSSKGYIQEVGMDFSENPAMPIWHMWYKFQSSDHLSGAGCLLAGHDNHENHMYLRNATTKALQQWTWDYTDVSSWTSGATGNTNMISGSDIAVTNDGTGTDYIFYQDSNGNLERALFYGGSGITGHSTISPKPKMNTKLTAAYSEATRSSGHTAVVLFQSDSDSASILYDEVSSDSQSTNAVSGERVS